MIVEHLVVDGVDGVLLGVGLLLALLASIRKQI